METTPSTIQDWAILVGLLGSLFSTIAVGIGTLLKNKAEASAAQLSSQSAVAGLAAQITNSAEQIIQSLRIELNQAMKELQEERDERRKINDKWELLVEKISTLRREIRVLLREREAFIENDVKVCDNCLVIDRKIQLFLKDKELLNAMYLSKE